MKVKMRKMKLMILDPQNDIRLIDYIQTQYLVGSPIYNFYSLFDCGMILNNLKPAQNLMFLLRDSQFGDSDTLDFDKAYADQILGNPYSFMDLMMMLSGIEKYDSTILLSNYNNKVIMSILDSLLKLIQERYGLDYFIYNILEDIDTTEFSQFTDAAKYQVFLYDQERYIALLKQYKNIDIKSISQIDINEDLESLTYSPRDDDYAVI